MRAIVERAWGVVGAGSCGGRCGPVCGAPVAEWRDGEGYRAAIGDAASHGGCDARSRSGREAVAHPRSGVGQRGGAVTAASAEGLEQLTAMGFPEEAAR